MAGCRTRLQVDDVDTNELKIQLQGHFTDGLSTIVGSGLSAASGLPTMSELAIGLCDQVPRKVSGGPYDVWDVVAQRILSGVDLETALHDVEVDHHLLEAIVEVTADFIGQREARVFQEVWDRGIVLPFSRLLPHLLSANPKGAEVITSNYDRLLELSAEVAGCEVDCSASGHLYAPINRSRSRESLTQAVLKVDKSKTRRVLRPHLAILKPHGSLDWFYHQGTAVRCSLPIRATRLMIAPGSTKFREGYKTPFDEQRSAANRCIDVAARYLILGYGFNDDDLETHLRRELAKGKPCVVLAKTLTDRARDVLSTCPSVLALEDLGAPSNCGTRVRTKGEQFEFPDMSIWDVNHFVEEVLT